MTVTIQAPAPPRPRTTPDGSGRSRTVPAAKPPTAKPAPPVAAPSRPRRQVALTPMRQAAAKSMRKLAASVQGTHPDMTVHDHLRDAARTLESGNEEASQRHLRAAMFALTPQSLMRNGLHTDDDHQAARGAMHSVHRHLLLVKDISDAGERNRAAIRRDSGDGAAVPPPRPDANAGYGPGANAQKPAVRQPPGDQALNAPAKADGGGSDPAAADPNGPQPRGSKQFTTQNGMRAVTELAYSWNDLDAVIEFSAQTAALESTPAPYGKPGGPGLYGVAGNKHSDYYEQIVQALMTKRGMDKAKASQVAWGVLRKWAHGGGGVHPEVAAAASKALAGEAAASARAGGHSHAASWDQVERDIRLSSVIELFNPAEARLPPGTGGGQFTTGGAAPPPASGQQPAKGKQPAKQTPAQKAAAEAHAKHLAHVAHVAHVNGVSTKKAALMVTADDDRKQAAGLIKQRNALQKALASAGGKTSSGQAGAKTSTTATTKSTAPAKSTAAAPATPAAASASAPAKAPASTSKTPAASTSASAAAPKAGSTAGMKAQLAQLNTQINNLLAQAKQAATQAAAMK